MVWCWEAACWATYLGLDIFKSIEELESIDTCSLIFEWHHNCIFMFWLNFFFQVFLHKHQMQIWTNTKIKLIPLIKSRRCINFDHVFDDEQRDQQQQPGGGRGKTEVSRTFSIMMLENREFQNNYTVNAQ